MNRKKRKLKYIREKNALRKGALLVSNFKVNYNLDIDLIKETAEEELKQLTNYYKLPLVIDGLKSKFLGADFMSNTSTIIVHFKIKTK